MPYASRSGSETDGEAQPAARAGEKKHSGRRLRGYPKQLAVLQAKISSLTSQAGRLLSEQQQLREREEALYTHIQEQGEFVHDIVALLAQQQQQQQQHQEVPGSQPLAGPDTSDCSTREEAVLDALSQSAINDLRIQHALLLLGKGRAAGQAGSSGGAGCRGELRSTACLRAALTAENIAWARRASMGEVLALYRGRIMRAAFLLAHPGNRGLADSLEAVVAQVVTTHMLLFAAADKLVLQLSLVNCNTGRPAVASPDHFRQVAAALPLSPEQRQQLRSAFQVYTTRRAALIARLQPLARQMSALLTKGSACACHAQHPPTQPLPATDTTATAAAIAPPAHTAHTAAASSGTAAGAAGRCCCCCDGSAAAAAAGLSLEEAEQLAGLLRRYEAAVGQCRLLGRSLSWHWLNVLDVRQLATAAVAAYPMYLQPIQICAAT
ncbi:hypothetical protein OEZ86_014730 [Tetradesmus obliquus]|nr:hypothetical protein OEZ86_014730 [Tetradesmus obliquus]